MPTYTYTCTACNDVVEKRQSFSDPPLTTCEQCGGALRKIIHPVGIVFKGSGWYITDSRTGSTSASSSTSSSPNGPTSPGGAGDSKGTASKASESSSSSGEGSATSGSASPAPSPSTPAKD